MADRPCFPSELSLPLRIPIKNPSRKGQIKTASGHRYGQSLRAFYLSALQHNMSPKPCGRALLLPPAQLQERTFGMHAVGNHPQHLSGPICKRQHRSFFYSIFQRGSETLSYTFSPIIPFTLQVTRSEIRRVHVSKSQVLRKIRHPAAAGWALAALHLKGSREEPRSAPPEQRLRTKKAKPRSQDLHLFDGQADSALLTPRATNILTTLPKCPLLANYSSGFAGHSPADKALINLSFNGKSALSAPSGDTRLCSDTSWCNRLKRRGKLN